MRTQAGRLPAGRRVANHRMARRRTTVRRRSNTDLQLFHDYRTPSGCRGARADRGLHGLRRRHDREPRPRPTRLAPERHPIRPGMGRQRLHALLRRGDARCRSDHGHPRREADIRGRPAGLHRVLSGLRDRHLDADVRHRPAGPRRGLRSSAAEALVLATTSATDERTRHRLVGWWTAAGGIGMAAGPLLGGTLVALADWRAVFAVNVVIGIPAIVWSLRSMPTIARRPRRLETPAWAPRPC